MTTQELELRAKDNKEWDVGPKPGLMGERFGRLLVVGMMPGRDNNGRRRWLCLCDCGAIIDTSGNNLKRGHSSSCGCLRRESSRENMKSNRRTVVVHGHARKIAPRERTYNIWQRMKERCYLKSNQNYHRYGGRGILVCDDWWDYIKFRDWAMSSGYADNLTIDRIDNDGPYCPGNCQWITQSENSKKRWKDNDKTRTVGN